MWQITEIIWRRHALSRIKPIYVYRNSEFTTDFLRYFFKCQESIASRNAEFDDGNFLNA